MSPEQPEVLVEQLVAAWNDPRADEESRWAPARELARWGGPALGPVLQACDTASAGLQDVLVGVLAAIGREAVPGLLAGLREASLRGREAAAEALGLLRDPRAVAALVEAVLQDPEPLQSAAAAALARIGAPAADALVEALAGADDESRWLLASSLVAIGAPAVPALLRLLKGSRGSARAVAAEALARIGGEPALAALLGLLDSSDPAEWEFAARALANGGPAVIHPLVSALETEDDRRRAAAVAALVRVGRDHVRELLDAPLALTPQRRPLVGLVLRRVGDPVLDALLERLGSEDSFLRKTGAEGLGWLGDPRATAPLVRALSDGNGRVRQAAAVALVRLASPVAVAGLGAVVVQPLVASAPRLSRLSDDSYWRVLDTLREVTDPDAVRPLVRALGAADAGLRQAAGAALARIGVRAVGPLVECAQGSVEPLSRAAQEVLETIGPAAVPALVRALAVAGEEELPRLRRAIHALRSEALPRLIAALSDPDPRMRLAAARGLYGMPEDAAVDPLLSLLSDEEEAVRTSAAAALASFGHLAAVRLLSREEAAGAEARFILACALIQAGGLGLAVDVGAPAVIPLIEAAREAEGRHRWSLVTALRLIRDPEAVEALLAALVEAEDIREAALDSLAAIGEPASSALRQALRSPDEGTRWHAALRLARIEGCTALPPEFVPLLLPLAAASSVEVRRAALRLLPARPEPGVIEAEVRALRDPDGEVRRVAAGALAAIGEPAAPSLIQALQDADPAVRLLAARTLGQIGVPVLPALLAAVRTVEENRRWDVLYAVTRIHAPEAVVALTGLLEDPDWHVRSTAALALGFLEGRCGAEALALTLNDPDEKVRLSTVAALGRIGGRHGEWALRRLRRDRSERVREAALAALEQLQRPPEVDVEGTTMARVREYLETAPGRWAGLAKVSRNAQDRIRELTRQAKRADTRSDEEGDPLR